MFLNEQGRLPLNGVPQYVSIRAEKEGLPLLLYLHGGPGDAALPLVLKHNRDWERHFTVVIWEQRGAGKSYYPFGAETVTIELFLQDLHELAILLTRRFHQKNLYLLGHSWGSVLGLKFLDRYPELVRAYWGCGQVVNMKKSSQTAYEFAVDHAGQKEREKLRDIDCAYAGEHWLEDLLFVTGQVVKHGGSLYGKSNYNRLVQPFLCSRYYSPLDLIRRQKGSLQSIRALWQELMQVDFEGITKFGAPVVFLEGRHDSHVSSALARQYYDSIQSEKKFYWLEESAHFPQWSESGRFNQLVAELAER